MRWLVLFLSIVLPDMYVLVGVVPPLFVAWYIYVLVVVLPPHCFPCYTCAGWCGATPLCWVVCKWWLRWCYHIVLPGMIVLVDVVPPHCVARYARAG